MDYKTGKIAIVIALNNRAVLS